MRFENLELIILNKNLKLCERCTESVRFKKCIHGLTASAKFTICVNFMREKRFARLAQLVERVIDVDDVRGSNPLSRTKTNEPSMDILGDFVL